MTLIDSYTESNQSDFYSCSTQKEGIGQSFAMGSSSYYLTSAKFYIKYATATDWSARAYIFDANSGTIGTDGIPSVAPASALEASSTLLNGSSTTTSYVLYEFEFAGTTVLNANSPYTISCNLVSRNSGLISIGCDVTSPTHSGNLAYYSGTTWSGESGEDCIFYLYGIPVSSSGSVKKTIPTALIATTTGVNDTQ